MIVPTFQIYNAILTGSRVYGTPKITSDTDLVIRVDMDTAKMLKAAHPEYNAGRDYPEEESGTIVFQFGALNLICALTDEVFAEWIQGTQALRNDAPVSRDESVEFFKRLRAKGVEQSIAKVAPKPVEKPVYEPRTCTASDCGAQFTPSYESQTLCHSCDIPF